MNTHSKVIISATALFLLMFSANNAYAYLDPGTGSMMIQALLATIAAVSVFRDVFWRHLRLFFGRLFGRRYSRGQD